MTTMETRRKLSVLRGRKLRYDKQGHTLTGATAMSIGIGLYREIASFLSECRAPIDAQMMCVEMLEGELTDRRAEEALSWDPFLTPTNHAKTRHLQDA